MGNDAITVVVTRLKRIGWGIRFYYRGKLLDNWSQKVRARSEIGASIKESLRMIDKCGFSSPMADASRRRFFLTPKHRE